MKYRYLGHLNIPLENAKHGIVDLGPGGGQPGQIIPQALLKTNTNYDVGLLLSDAGPDELGDDFAAAVSGLAFAVLGQPQNDSIEVLSDTAGDVGRVVTIYATSNGSNRILKGTATLDAADGTTPVTVTLEDGTAKADWGWIVGVEVDAAHATAVLTIREASGNVTCIDIGATETSVGITDVAEASQSAYGLAFQAFAEDATTKVAGVWGQDVLGNEYGEIVTLAGTTLVAASRGYHKITKVFTGDVEAAREVTFQIPTLANSNQSPGALTLGACHSSIAGFGADDDGDDRIMAANGRYLHWLLLNGTTPTAGGADDWLLVKLYG